MVTDMTDRQALLLDHVERTRWYKLASSSTKKRPARAWFAPNSREQIRDETIRIGLIPNGAVVQKKGVPTTSPAPKYALAASFADLFDEALSGHELHDAIEKWQTANLSKSALTRVTLLTRGATTASGHVLVKYPNGDTRRLSPGPSAVLSKAVVEEFSSRYLRNAAVLWLSESASKVQDLDRNLAERLSLHIDPARELPDLILIDAGDSSGGFLVVFIEVVATDGPVNEHRKRALLEVATNAGFDPKDVCFLTAYQDRSSAAFKKTVADLALGSFIWFMAEPDSLMVLREGRPVPLSSLR